MPKAEKKSITPSASRAKRPSKAAKRSPRHKSQALPAKRPTPFDVIADRFDFDKVESVPAMATVGRAGWPNGDASRKGGDLALKNSWRGRRIRWPFTHAQLKRIAELALGRVCSKRRELVWDRHLADEIQIDHVDQLQREIDAQYLEEIDTLAARDPGVYLTSCSRSAAHITVATRSVLRSKRRPDTPSPLH